LKTTRNIYNVV